jgi:iron(III) transport system substrate-binding protein
MNAHVTPSSCRPSTRGRARHAALLALLACLALIVAACSSNSSTQPSALSQSAASTAPPSLTLYTSVTQNTVDSVVAGFKSVHPGASVTVFRATTGAINARLAADERTGGVRADVIWGTDPLSMQAYAAQGLLRDKPIASPTGIPTQYETNALYPTRLLYVVIVARKGLTPLPVSWSDLTNPAYRGKVAIPDPAAAGSALAALGYFATAPGYGMSYFQQLKSNGAVQVATVPEVVTDVAQGRYELGITLDSEVRTAAAAGSPVQIVWPTPGPIALYSPIAVTTATKRVAAADAFLDYVLSSDAQKRIAATGWQPVLPGIAGPPIPAGVVPVSADWPSLFGRQKALLQQYQALFGS